jgi:hypothetical protein
MRNCASRACGQDHGCSSETAPRATRSSALSGHACVMGWEAAGPQLGGLVPPRETGGRALLPRGSRPARPARMPPAPVPGFRPPVESLRLSLWMRRRSSRFITRLPEKLREALSILVPNVWEAAVPQIGGLVPLRETGGRALLPRGSRPARPARMPPRQCLDPAPRWNPYGCLHGMRRCPRRFITRLPEKTSKGCRSPVTRDCGHLCATRASARSSRQGWLPWEIRERMEKSRDERRSHASLPVEAHLRPATDG